MRLRIVRALAVLVASAAALVVGAAPAHADSVTTVGYYTDNLDHGGNAALGRVKFEAWIIQLRNSSGVVYGTVGRTRMCDVGGGVQALQVNRSALKWANNGTSIQRNDTAQHQTTPGNGICVQSDSNDSIGNSFWASTVGNSQYNGILAYDTNVSVRWGDNQLGTYSLGSLNAFWYRCANGTLGACGSVSQSIPA